MATLVNLDYDQAHNYVDRMRGHRKSIVKWDGWNIEVFTPHSRAYFRNDGAYRDGKWGFVTTIEPDSNGTWRVYA
jgi:hypothetical protein